MDSCGSWWVERRAPWAEGLRTARPGRDLGPDGEAAKYYFQESGELTSTINFSPATGEVKGSIQNGRLIEVEIDCAGKTFTSNPVAGGAGLEVEDFDFDTTVPAGDAATCDDAADCGLPESGAH